MSTTETFKISTQRNRHGRMSIHDGAAPAPVMTTYAAAPARIARVVAVAHHVDHLVRSGVAKSYADVGDLGSITRARVSQITNLLFLSPSIQERLLFMIRPAAGREQIGERDLRAICMEPDWSKQEVMFDRLLESKGMESPH